MKSKVQMQWEILNEQAKEFISYLPKFIRGIETELFFKGLRQTEYRRGKEDAIKLTSQLPKSDAICNVQVADVGNGALPSADTYSQQKLDSEKNSELDNSVDSLAGNSTKAKSGGEDD